MAGLPVLIFINISTRGLSQELRKNDSGLLVISDAKVFRKSVKENPDREMLELSPQIPGIRLDLRYATQNNFTGVRLYPRARAFVTRAAYIRLLAVLKDLREEGLGLKIFDCYRPYAVTEKMWALIHDERYVADPKKGSGHNRGIAIDLTLYRLSNGVELSMPTGFDNFSDTAHHQFTALPDSVIRHRQLLKSVMEKNGFKAYDTEWWHYYLPQAQQFPLLNLSFRKLGKLSSRAVAP